MTVFRVGLKSMPFVKSVGVPLESSSTEGKKPPVFGRLTFLPFGFAKLKADVKSPTTARRQGEMFGSNTPKRFSMKRMTEVWSNTWETT